MSESEQSNSELDSVMTVKLPPYGINNPKLWFARVEAVFDCRRITSQTSRYSHIVAYLPDEVASEIPDLIYNRPPLNPYNAIKEALIARTAVSDEQNLRTLLSGIKLGDRTPSQLLRHMTQLMGKEKSNDAILKELWLQNLPAEMRTVLSIVNKDTTLDNLAQLADQVHSSYCLKTVSSVENPTTSNVVLEKLDSLMQDFSSMKLEINALKTQLGRSRSRSQSRGSPASRTSSPISHNKVRICRFHRQFGSAARNCKPYCTFYTTTKSGNIPAEQ